MRVAILGAYGAVGRRLTVESARLGHQVTAAGRDPKRLATVQAASRAQIGVEDKSGLRRLTRHHDVLVNATGVESIELAQLSVECGAAFMDISADSGYLDRLGSIHDPARPIAAGVGLAPGLTNLLAAATPGTGPLDIGIIGGIGEEHGAAAREWIWRGAGHVVYSGGHAQRVYRTTRSFDVPGLGRRRLLRAHFGEQDQLSHDLGRPVSSWLSLDPAWATATLRLAGLMPSTAPLLDRLSGPFARLVPSKDHWRIVIAEGDQTIGWAYGRREVNATAAVAALCITPLAQAAPGIYPAHRLTTLDTLADDLAHTGIVTMRRDADVSGQERPKKERREC